MYSIFLKLLFLLEDQRRISSLLIELSTPFCSGGSFGGSSTARLPSASRLPGPGALSGHCRNVVNTSAMLSWSCDYFLASFLFNAATPSTTMSTFLNTQNYDLSSQHIAHLVFLSLSCPPFKNKRLMSLIWHRCFQSASQPRTIRNMLYTNR